VNHSITTIFIALLPLAASAGDLQAEPNNPQTIKDRTVGRYYQEVEAMGPLDNSTAQTVAFMNSFVGRTDLFVTMENDWAFVNQLISTCPVPDGAKLQHSPISYLVEKAKNVDLLLLNESHHRLSPRHFLLQNLEALWAAGYRHIGFEALGFSAETLGEFDGKGPDDCYYCSEPTLAGAMRRALGLGISIFAYEYMGKYPDDATWQDKMRVREAGQAMNIAAYMRSVPAGGKVLIWAGYQHISKKRQTPEEGPDWMAARLTSEHGLSTYAVDLTMCTIDAGVAESTAVLLLDPESTPVLSQVAQSWLVDAQLRLPAPAQSAPGFFRSALGAATPIPARLRSLHDTILVEAHLEGQPQSAFPYDRIFLRGGEEFPLYLPNGRFMLRAYGDDGSLLAVQTVGVGID
jgi:hypothetical protein